MLDQENIQMMFKRTESPDKPQARELLNSDKNSIPKVFEYSDEKEEINKQIFKPPKTKGK